MNAASRIGCCSSVYTFSRSVENLQLSACRGHQQFGSPLSARHRLRAESGRPHQGLVQFLGQPVDDVRVLVIQVLGLPQLFPQSSAICSRCSVLGWAERDSQQCSTNNGRTLYSIFPSRLKCFHLRRTIRYDAGAVSPAPFPRRL